MGTLGPTLQRLANALPDWLWKVSRHGRVASGDQTCFSHQICVCTHTCPHTRIYIYIYMIYYLYIYIYIFIVCDHVYIYIYIYIHSIYKYICAQ